jgi:hypothetical protein
MTDKDHVPIGALKRLAQDLNSSHQKSEIYVINKKRINDFIQNPYYTPMYKPIRQSEEEKVLEESSNSLVVGVHLYPVYNVRVRRLAQ